MKLGLVQYNPVWEDKESNKEKITFLLNSVSEKIDLFIFPEMTLTGFTMKSKQFAEKVSEDTFNFFSKIAIRFSAHILAGMVELSEGKIYNSLIHIDNTGRFIKSYKKIHPFSAGGEDLNYSKGIKPIITKLDDWSTGLAICYDLRFPELFRFYGKQGVDLIIDISNWPDTRIDHWQTLLKARAIENQCYVAGVNRVGDDQKQHYCGSSCVYGPMGEELIRLNDNEIIGTVEIDKSNVDDVRKHLPFLKDITLI
jgi:omega-amidase